MTTFPGTETSALGGLEAEMVPDPDDVGLTLPAPMASNQRARRRLITHAIVRIVAVTVFLVAAYLAAPVGQDADTVGLTVLVLGGIGFVAALVFQVRRILDSPAPQLRAVEALVTTLVLVIVVFAFIYVCMSATSASSFSEPITKANGLYFTVTVLATVGFGDITATTETARMVVTGQMLLNLLIVGVVVKILMGASRIAVERRRTEAGATRSPASDQAGATDA